MIFNKIKHLIAYIGIISAFIGCIMFWSNLFSKYLPSIPSWCSYVFFLLLLGCLVSTIDDEQKRIKKEKEIRQKYNMKDEYFWNKYKDKLLELEENQASEEHKDN